MSEVPADVRSTLAQLLGEAEAAARARDDEELLHAVRRVATLTADEVPEGDLRERLRHGCRRVERVAADEPLVAAAYCEAMRRRVEG